MVVLDGVGDRPNARLGGKTPLEAANTPVMDQLAERGISGFVSALAPWIPVGTQTGLGMLMGLARGDVRRLTRGPVEAAGVGMTLRPGDVALRCNLATLARNGDRFDIIDRRAGRITDLTDALLSSLDGIDVGEGITVQVRPSTAHRAVILLRGTKLSAAISDTDPGAGNENLGVLTCASRSGDDAGKRTAQALNKLIEISFEVLSAHPVNEERRRTGKPAANGLITRGAGSVFECRNLISNLGVTACIVTGEGTAMGLGKLFGFSVIDQPSFTASTDTDVHGKIAAAMDALKEKDFVFVHIKGTDVAAHDRNPELKRDFLERIDLELKPLLADNLVVGITGDHSTDCNSGRHTGDPVPTILCAPDVRVDDVAKYGEQFCAAGRLGHISATSFLCACLDLMNAMHNHRAYEYFFYS